MQPSVLHIELRALPEGVHEHAVRPSAEELEVDPALFSDIAVDLTLDHQEDRLLVHYEVSATAHLECDRTLEPFEQALEATDTAFFGLASVVGSADQDRTFVLDPDAEVVDLTQPVRDALVLALPVRRIAPGNEDLDIQTQFGTPASADEAIDPRWAALKKLKFDDNDAS
ncbi:MAG: DUF177 domain-containing protein [Bacteroidota bacterium]